jgi:hypothetical protein
MARSRAAVPGEKPVLPVVGCQHGGIASASQQRHRAVRVPRHREQPVAVDDGGDLGVDDRCSHRLDGVVRAAEAGSDDQRVIAVEIGEHGARPVESGEPMAHDLHRRARVDTW